jgi:ABC-type amino acid transport substrate-binding protein
MEAPYTTESRWEQWPITIVPTRRRKVTCHQILLLIAAIFIALSACDAAAQDQKRPLRFLGNRSIPPFVSLQDGQPVGIVVDLAYALADKAGLPIIVEAMDWSTAQSEVLHGKADALLQINPNPERERIYDFSDPVLDSKFQIFRKATRTDIQSLDSLRGLKVGVESGGFPAQHLGGGGEFQLVLVPTWKAAFILLNAGQVDAVIVDRWVGEYELAINRFEGITIVDPPVAENYSRIAVGKGNKELLEEINLGLIQIKQDGTYQRILDEWQPLGVIYFTRQFVDNLALYGIVICGAIIVGVSILIFNAAARKKLLATLEQRITHQSVIKTTFLLYLSIV